MALTRAEISRRYRDRHPEKMKAAMADWAVRNRAKRAAYMRDYYRLQRQIRPEHIKLQVRRSRLKLRYGISLEHYDALLERQGGKCGICGSTDPRDKRYKYFHVDHCHETGHVRGLLCSRYNNALGTFGDNAEGVERALKYLNGRGA